MGNKPKKFQIAVNGQYKTTTVFPVDPHFYYIQAENEEKAKEQALTKFHEAYPNAENVSTTKGKIGNGPAIVFSAIAIFISLIPWRSGRIELSIAPSMLSTMIAIALYSSVIVRLKGLHNSFKCASETILSCLTILLCSSFINLFFGDANVQILEFALPISGKALLAFAIIISWIGITVVAKFVWIALFILAAIRIVIGDAAMGFWGNIYVLSAFLGIVFMLKQESSAFHNSLGQEMVSIAARTKQRIVK